MKPSFTRVRKALRAAERLAKKLGPDGYRGHVVAKGCIVGNVHGYQNCSSKIDFAHGHGKDGQTWKSAFGCCSNHHTLRGDSFHTMGAISFALHHGVDPVAVAAANVAEWDNQQDFTCTN